MRKTLTGVLFYALPALIAGTSAWYVTSQYLTRSADAGGGSSSVENANAQGQKSSRPKEFRFDSLEGSALPALDGNETIEKTWLEVEKNLAAANAGDARQKNHGIVEAVAKVWRNRDPALAVKFLAEKDAGLESQGLKACIRAWAVREPDAWREFARAASLTDPEFVARAFAMLGNHAEAKQLATALDGEPKQAFLDRYVGSLTPSARLSAGRAFSAADLPEDAAQIVCQDFLTYGPADLPGWMSSLDPAKRASLLDSSYSGRLEGARPAEDYLKARLAIGAPPERQIETVFCRLGLYETDTAMALADQLPPDLRATALRHFEHGRVSRRWDKPEELIQHLSSLAGAVKSDAVLFASSYWSDENVTPLLSYIATLEDAKLQADAYANLVARSQHIDLAKAREIMLRQLQTKAGDVNPLEYGVESVVIRGLGEDPAGGRSWVQSLPPGPLKERATEVLAQYWARLNSVECAEWIERLSPGPERDRAVAQLVAAAPDDAERAVENLNAISDPKIRLSVARILVQQWKDADPDYLLGLLRKSAISAEEISELERQITKADRAK
jgi:hypothetical protein